VGDQTLTEQCTWYIFLTLTLFNVCNILSTVTANGAKCVFYRNYMLVTSQ